MHTLAGNPKEVPRIRPVPISADDEWRSGMSRRDQWVIAGVTLPFLLRYEDYPVLATAAGAPGA